MRGDGLKPVAARYNGTCMQCRRPFLSVVIRPLCVICVPPLRSRIGVMALGSWLRGVTGDAARHVSTRLAHCLLTANHLSLTAYRCITIPLSPVGSSPMLGEQEGTHISVVICPICVICVLRSRIKCGMTG